jgi:phage gp29-like protein
MARNPTLLDRWGRPIVRSVLQEEVAAATVGGVRSPISGYPADGLNPVRLAHILREADQGDPLRYLELAETIEERDPHYLGVLGTRKRSVSQIDISVEAASDDPADVAKADMVREWLTRDELNDELFDILDCIGKGYSFTEIIWDTSEGQWRPTRLEWRDPRWFRFERRDLATPVMLDDSGQERPLDPFKFVFATLKAKSGLALRSGLARVAAWGWMFKAFTQRDWAIFTQTFGQPLRVGKYGAGASEADKDTLFRAVSQIAGDCAAIIPEAMAIDFIESKTVGASSTLYRERADWLDQQISKAVLGQTATTDAIAGGHAVGQEHREVQEDIERADAKALSAILNRDLIRPWIDLEFGPQQRYPRLVIARPEVEDIKGLVEALGILVPLGMRVGASEVRDRLKLSEPAPDDEILGQKAPDAPPAPPATEPAGPDREIKRVSGEIKRGDALSGVTTALNAEGGSAAFAEPPSAEAELADQLAEEAAPAMVAMLGKIEAMLAAAGSLEEFAEMLRAGFPALDATALADRLAEGMILAQAAGRIAVEQDRA